MIQDVPEIMKERDVDCLVALGREEFCPEVHYLTRGAPISHCVYILRPGERPHLVHTVIETDGAMTVDADRSIFQDYGMDEIYRAEDDPLTAAVELYRRIFEKHGVKGRVSMNGNARFGLAWAFLRGLDEAIPDLEIVPEYHGAVLEVARRTKDEQEVGRIARAGEGTCTIFRAVEEMLASAERERDGLVDAEGDSVTVGSIKRKITNTAHNLGLAETHGTIFAQGRDAAVPHNHGDERMPIRPGQPLIADIFPQESGGGYFFDMTRTYCVGSAPDELARLYEDVREATELGIAELRVGDSTVVSQEKVCEFFEAKGYETPRTHPGSASGYIHSLGHGVGLEIHEKPTLSHFKTGGFTIEAGMVLTIEPGLYYPDKEYGVRIEDIVYIEPDGSVRNLTRYPYRLEIAGN